MSLHVVPPIVKICGITRPEDARVAVEAGADWLGLNFWPSSKRHIGIERGIEIAAAARETSGDVVLVGVFVNQLADGVRRIAVDVGLDYVQLHGDESPDQLAELGANAFKALSLGARADVDRISDYAGEVVLVDTPTAGYGGSGQTFDWTLARAAVATGRNVILAGGLTPDNVGAAVRDVKPYGVDVASGVESAPGVKDAELVRAFVRAAKGRS